MIYIIEGEEDIFVRNKISELTNKQQYDVVKFDGTNKDLSLQDVVESCNNNSLFSTKIIILFKDPSFLIKKIDEKLVEPILNYVANPNFETELIFYTYENKFNSKLKIYKIIEKNAEVLKFNSFDYKNFNTYVNQEIRKANLNISSDAIMQLSQICKRSASLLNQNLNILKNYPDKITKDVVKKLCTVSDDNDSFELINAITNKEFTKVVELERKMFNENNSIYAVIGLLANQLRFLYRLSYLVSVHKRRVEIMDELKISDYRYNKSVESLSHLNMSQILDLLENLSKLDILLKTNNSIDDQTRFEMFVLNMKEN